MPKTKTSRGGEVTVVAQASAGKISAGGMTVRDSRGKKTASSFWDSPKKVARAAEVQTGSGGAKKTLDEAKKRAKNKKEGIVQATTKASTQSKKTSEQVKKLRATKAKAAAAKKATMKKEDAKKKQTATARKTLKSRKAKSKT